MKRKLLVILMAMSLIFVPLVQSASAQSFKKVVIDPGHGGSDSGAIGYGLREKDLTLNISQKVNQNLLNHYDVHTKMTRNSDVYISLKQRTDLANAWGANLFLSIHINAGGGTGYEDYTHNKNATAEDKKVQAAINKEINKVLESYKKKNRGQKQANFHVLRESKMTSILLEILFIDNKSDADLLKNERFLEDVAEAISTGVANAMALPTKGSSADGNSSADTPAKDKIAVSKASGTYIVIADSLNVRAGDGTNYPSVGSLKKNTQVKVTGKTSKGWYQFTFKGKPAYVSGAYLKVKPAATKPENEPIKVSKASGTYVVTANSLNVRAGNGSQYASLGALKKNSQVKITGKTSNNWYRISFKGKTGYVSGAYLKLKTAASKPAPKPVSKPKNDSNKVTKASGTYIVTANSLNVRAGNGSKYTSLGALKKNNQVKVTGKTSNNWYRITFKGKTGYVSGSYLKPKTAAAKPAPKPVSKPKNNSNKVTKASGTYVVTANSLNVRAGNGSKYTSLGALKKNSQVKVTGKTSNNWYQITFKGKTGYVSGAYLKLKTAAAKSNAIKVTKANGKYKVTASKLYVRLGNNTNYKSIGYLKKNAKINVTGKTSNGWYRINLKGKVGYVSGKYLKR